MDSTHGINGGQLENINLPIDEILQSIIGNHEEDSRIISPNEIFRENTDNDNEVHSHYFKITEDAIKSSNSSINTSNSDQMSSPSYIELSSPELTTDNNHPLDPITNSIPIPIASIPPQLTHPTIPKILPPDHKTPIVYVGMKSK